MIEILFFVDSENAQRFQGFIVSGHAEYDEPGRDIVCAAVSALTQSVVLGLEEVIDYPVEVELDRDGLLDVRLIGHDSECAEKDNKAQVLLQTIYESLLQVESEYPEGICVKLDDIIGGGE